MVTVILEVDSPVFHNKVPVAVVERTELPQLFVTVTTGVAGADFGAAIPLPVALVQPLTVEVTL